MAEARLLEPGHWEARNLKSLFSRNLKILNHLNPRWTKTSKTSGGGGVISIRFYKIADFKIKIQYQYRNFNKNVFYWNFLDNFWIWKLFEEPLEYFLYEHQVKRLLSQNWIDSILCCESLAITNDRVAIFLTRINHDINKRQSSAEPEIAFVKGI